jgi:hypothetical protein
LVFNQTVQQPEIALREGADGADARSDAGAQLTTIKRDGEISTRILRRWDDRVGEKIAA